MRSFMRNHVAMRQMKMKLRCLKPHRPYTIDFPIDARESVEAELGCRGANFHIFDFSVFRHIFMQNHIY